MLIYFLVVYLLFWDLFSVDYVFEVEAAVQIEIVRKIQSVV